MYSVFFSWSDLLPLQERLTLDPKWRKYFSSLEEKTKSNQNHLNTGDVQEKRRRRSSAPFETIRMPSAEERTSVWKQMCENSGLQVVQCEMVNAKYDFGDIESFRAELRALCHFLPWIPESEREDFLVDYYSLIDGIYMSRGTTSNVILEYQYILLIAEKKALIGETLSTS